MEKPENKITIYHGSEKILKVPEFGKGEIYNDYGMGFYCTKNKGLAGEWAVLWTGHDGYINEYSFDYTNLKILYLNQMPIENWLSVLAMNRRGDYEQALQQRIDLFVAKYGVDISNYDIIEGWRADDAFFSYVEDFFTMFLSLENLKEALKFGDLGNQVCLKSRKAFDVIKFVAFHPAPASRFFQSAKNRDATAKYKYYNMPDKDKGTLLINLIGRWN
jgi:hypothetical protein